MFELAIDFDAIIVGARVTGSAAGRERWAADEMIGCAQILTPRAAFPSFRFARLMAKTSRAA